MDRQLYVGHDIHSWDEQKRVPLWAGAEEEEEEEEESGRRV